MEGTELADEKFALGDLKITSATVTNVPLDEVFDIIKRHRSGDWGDVTRKAWEMNDFFLRTGFTLSSRYNAKDGTRLWIVTRHDRLATNVLLASETEV